MYSEMHLWYACRNMGYQNYKVSKVIKRRCFLRRFSVCNAFLQHREHICTRANMHLSSIPQTPLSDTGYEIL